VSLRTSPPPVTVLPSASAPSGDPAVDGSKNGSDLGDRFVLGARLGKGGMGEVFLGHDGRLNREMAVKVLGSGDGASFRLRFLREAQITAQLSHPNVVPVYGLERSDGGRPALAMKLIRGVTFAEYIQECRDAAERGDTHGLAARVEHFLKVCDAIAYSHDRGVLHRDLKPTNLMLGPFGEVYVVDWGIARVLADGPDDGAHGGVDDGSRGAPEGSEGGATEAGPAADVGTLTKHGDLLGTPAYCPPEQAKGLLDEVGPAADQFALGMVLFELAALRRARQPKNEIHALHQAFEGHRETFEDVGAAAVPRELQAIVDRATRPSAAERYGSVQALAADLRRFLRGEEVRALPDPWPRALLRRAQRHPVRLLSGLLAIVLLAGAVAVASLGYVLQSERREAERRQVLAGLVSQVTRHVQTLDRRLLHTHTLLEGLASRTRELLAGPPLPATGALQRTTVADLARGDGPSDAAYSERYGQVVTMETPVDVLAPGTDGPEMAAFRARLGPLTGALRDQLVRSQGEDAVVMSTPDKRTLLRAGVPLIWAYVGFENGLLVTFPGNEHYPAGYDHRTRPWYTDPQGTRGPRFGAIYSDWTGTGYLLPASRAIYSDDGAYLGVAGLDWSLDELIDHMVVPGLDGVRESYLLDGRGRVVLSSKERGIRRGTGEQNRKERTPVGVKDLERRAREGAASGFVQEGDDLYVFGRLEAMPWLLVVRLDPAPSGLR